MYDSSDEESLRAADTRLHELSQCGLGRAVVGLVSNKSDLHIDPLPPDSSFLEVQSAARSFAANNNASFFEVSAKTGDGVQSAVESIIRQSVSTTATKLRTGLDKAAAPVISLMLDDQNVDPNSEICSALLHVDQMNVAGPPIASLASAHASGASYLQMASYEGLIQVVALLLERGAEIDNCNRANKQIAEEHGISLWPYMGSRSQFWTTGQPIRITPWLMTPLMAATAAGHMDVVQLLLANGANTVAESPMGSALGVAVRQKDTAFLALVLQHAAQDGKLDREYEGKDGPLHVLGQVFLEEIGLIVSKFGVVGQETDAENALLRPIENFMHERLDVLLEHGLRADTRVVNGFTMLHLAVIGKALSVVKLLLKSNASPDMRTSRMCEVTRREGSTVALYLWSLICYVHRIINRAPLGYRACRLLLRSDSLRTRCKSRFEGSGNTQTYHIVH